jgi:probable F420-dependent oxidoreductase
MAGTRFCNYRAPPMLLDAQLEGGVASAARQAAMAERSGFAGVWAAEVTRDPMLALAVAAGSTTWVTVGSNVVLAFARNPMSVAMQAWDLADATAGRFVLGLATQVKPHITRRFSMPWSDPVGRMREFVEALRHIFEVFQGEHPLDFRGQHYSHTLLHGMFNPGPIEHPRIPIGLGGVGPHLTALAGEVADGYLLHAFTNTAYQDAVTLPALERGLAASGRTRADIWVFGYLMLAAGDTEEEQARAADRIRGQIAFYASSPMYREVLDCIGCAELQHDLHQLVKEGRWADMPALVDDGVLDHFVVRGTLEELPARIRARYGAYYDRAVPYLGLDAVDPDRLQQFVTALSAPAG